MGQNAWKIWPTPKDLTGQNWRPKAESGLLINWKEIEDIQYSYLTSFRFGIHHDKTKLSAFNNNDSESICT